MKTNPYSLMVSTGRHKLANPHRNQPGMNAMRQRKRILIIDDEEVISFGFSMVLKEPDVAIDCAHTLNEARSHIAAHRYDAAIVDLRLSDSVELEGFECIRLLRTVQNGCRIIVLTANGEHGVKERAVALGVDRFYEKPLEPEVLRKTLSILNIYDSHHAGISSGL